MSPIGDRLREERIARGLSIEDIAERTRINPSLLEAIEAERFERLPGGFFLRSFVRQYARALGIPEDEFEPDLVQLTGFEPPPVVAAETEFHPDIPRGKVSGIGRSGFPQHSLGSLLALVLIIAACSSIYTLWERTRSSDSRSADATRTRSARPGKVPASGTGNTEATAPQPAAPLAEPPQPPAAPNSPAPGEPAATTAPAEPETAPGTGEPSKPPETPNPAIETAKLAAQPSAAAAGSAEPVQVDVRVTDAVWMRIIADGRKVFEGELRPGDSVRVGALLILEPGWHVYWQNPGQAGLPSALELELPEGLTALPVEWPLPTVFTQPGKLLGYGYEGSVLLAREVRIALDVKPTAKLPIAATASWLACRERCELGEAQLVGDLAAGTARVDPAAFARRQLPRPATDADLRVTTSGEAGEPTLWLQWPKPPGGVELLPAPLAGFRVDVRRLATRANLTRADLALRRVGASTPARELEALVLVHAADGSRRGYTVHADLP